MSLYFQILCVVSAEHITKRENTQIRNQQRLRPTTSQHIPQQRELSDIQLIKYISRNNRKGAKQRPRRRPKPVYGPPDYPQGTPIGPAQKPPRTKYGPPKQTAPEQERRPESVSYFPSNDYDASQDQHQSFAEPPAAPSPRPQPPAADLSLPIQSDTSAYRLPASTSYGVPVSPIINVYPDKLEYMKNNQPTSNLYNLFDSIPSIVPQTAYQPPFANPPPVFNYAEPKFNSSLHTYNINSGYYKDPYSPDGAIGEISDGEYSLEEEDEFSAEASSEQVQPRPYPKQNTRRPTQQHHSIFRTPTNQYVDDLLVFPKEPLGSSSSNVHTQSHSPFVNNFNHNLDTEDLREHYSAGTDQRPIIKRNRSKRRKQPKPDTTNPIQFGTRIGVAKTPATTTTNQTPLNYVLLSATNQQSDPNESTNIDSIPSTSITADPITALKLNVPGRVFKYRKAQYNDEKNDSISSESKLHPRHRDTYSTANDDSLQPIPTLPLAEPLRENIEIVSIDKSRSHSYYAGTVAPGVASKGKTKTGVEADHLSDDILSERILSDVIASIRE